MQNYRNFPQQGRGKPGIADAMGLPGRAPNQPPPGIQAPPPHITQMQLMEDRRRAEATRRIAKKPTDREIPDELGDVIVGDGVQRYAKLRDVERQLDAVMMRKRLDISDNLQRRYARREGVLRIWVSNTAEGQPWQIVEEERENGGLGMGFGEDGTFELDNNGRATYRVKIEGRLIDEGLGDENGEDDEGQGDDSTDAPQQRTRLSQFFKSITIDFQRNPALQPDGFSAIEWRKPQPGPANPAFDPNSPEVSFDTLEFERSSDDNIGVTINLVRDEAHERFRLSPQLAEVLDTDEEDRAGVIQGIWEYCRAMGLQQDSDKRDVVCDQLLRNLFGREKIYFPHLPEHLAPHLHPLPPIQLQYTIRVDRDYIKGTPASADSPTIPPSQPTVYDIRVSLPNPLARELTRFQSSKSHVAALCSIVHTDDDLALLVQKIHQTNAKRKFYDNLSKDPASFVKRWVSSQRRDLEVIMAESTRGGGEDGAAGVGDEWRKGGSDGVWGSQLARESVGLWLARSGKAH